LQDKEAVRGKPTIYVCYQQTCQAPVHTIDATTSLLNKIM
jgi:uncharacterized protein YyaL (SSP411 family)